MKCVRMLLFVFNFIFWLLGVALLVIGILSRTQTGSWSTLVEDSFVLTAANILIAAGVIVGLIGFLGCCGAIKKNTCMLTTFAACILVIFILELAGGIYAYTKTKDLQTELETGVKEAIKTSYGNSTNADDEFTKAIDWFQQNVKCCGSKEPGDWKNSNWYNKQKGAKVLVPESCCLSEKKGCNNGASIKSLIDNGKIYPKGCVPEGAKFVKNELYKVGGAAIGIGVVQLLGIIFACCLCQTIKKES